MPQGFQERFTYGERMSCFNKTPTSSWSYSGTPLIGYEAVYSYRSGSRAKFVPSQGNYVANSISKLDLRSKLLARKQFLENFITSSFEPQVGSPTVFSTVDTGHPFATFKVHTHQPYGRVTNSPAPGSSTTWDVSPNMSLLPFPDLTDPLGVATRTGTGAGVFGKQTYFSWPSSLFGGARQSPVAQQVISNGLKQTLGAGLIANANPRSAKADLAVTVLELLTGNLPRILARMGDNLTRIAIDWKLQTGKELGKHTNPGNEWLSYHFGWAPLVADVMAAIDVLYKLHILLFADDNTRRHRGGDLGTVARIKTSGFSLAGERSFNTANPFESGFTASPLVKDAVGTINSSPPTLTAGLANFSKTVRIESDYRFSARYHSGARANDAQRGYIDKAADLLGLDITPATLWNLAPWTWLLDWFSNIGTVAQNLSDLDWSNVLLDYAYLTLQVKTTMTSSLTVAAGFGDSTFNLNHRYLSQHVVQTERVREQASPYGFSVGWTGLSPFQLSILAALGMTRGR